MHYLILATGAVALLAGMAFGLFVAGMRRVARANYRWREQGEQGEQ